jgi:hypothetical protein
MKKDTGPPITFGCASWLGREFELKAERASGH